jgi:hypothetical protein
MKDLYINAVLCDVSFYRVASELVAGEHLRNEKALSTCPLTRVTSVTQFEVLAMPGTSFHLFLVCKYVSITPKEIEKLNQQELTIVTSL